MSLDYNLTEIANHREVCFIGEGDERRMNPVTNVIIMSTMSVGMGHIKPTNVDEFIARYRIIEQIHGPFLTERKKPYQLTDEDFIAHVGLTTNVSPESRAQWARRLFVNKQTSITEENAYRARRTMAKQTEATAAA